MKFGRLVSTLIHFPFFSLFFFSPSEFQKGSKKFGNQEISIVFFLLLKFLLFHSSVKHSLIKNHM